MTREHWLDSAVTALRPDFVAAGFPLSATAIKVSVGFPSSRATANTSRSIGQCFDRAAADGIPQLFVSPVLDNPTRVLDVLVHELIHAAVGCKCGHTGAFRRAALALGLKGKMTATTAGEALTARLTALAADLGAYPHAALSLAGQRKQTTRLLKAECVPCGYVVRLSRLMITAHGCPICPSCHSSMMEPV